ncbi:MAG TPA: ferrous iron transport protein B [Gammaproteobacteria bacterium]|nr:ferrous iron transport protein B [Gammaproteobacteria bacterium]
MSSPDSLAAGAARAATRRPVVVTIGNPNTGKSTLFNALTGLRQKVGNFPGVTVEHVVGTLRLAGGEVDVVDLPGTYSLSAQSPDEMVAVDVLLGRVPAVGRPDVVLLIVDATNLRRNLFLASQVLELGVPVVIALNMTDLLAAQGVTLDLAQLEAALGAPLVPIAAAQGTGLEALRAALAQAIAQGKPSPLRINPTLKQAADELAATLRARGVDTVPAEIERALIDEQGHAEQRLLARAGDSLGAELAARRRALAQGRSLATVEARDRYSWINALIARVERRAERKPGWREVLDRWLNHPVYGSLAFVLSMAIVFQSVFAWATPLMDGIDVGAAALGEWVRAATAPGLLQSFLVDGVIAGVGSVVVFLPQIALLFAFIIVLEDSGYMSRAAFVVDRLMRWCGLSGQSFIPMLSSFACAVPGIMGTRVIANPRDRLATILAAPFMTCSARLPIYALLIAAFVPQKTWLGGLVNLQGLVLLGFYLLGMAGAVFTAFLVNRLLYGGPRSRFLLEMPPYRLPQLKSVAVKLLGRVQIFLKRAGTIIFTVALVVWVLASFPRVDAGDGLSAAPPIAESYLGRASHAVAPVFAPLGWDWKVTAAVIASFPAREVVIAVLGTLYAVEDADAGGEARLIDRIKEAKRADGTPVFTLPMAIGLMVFYALCLQCISTLAVIRRETNSWRWPLASWLYMTTLGYLGAWLCFRLGSALAG